MNIAIIGAGPIGGYAAYLLAKSGHQVSIYEEHKEVGKPIQCTGLLTSDFEQFKLPTNDYLVNIFQGLEITSPKGDTTSLKQKEYLVDRHKFDSFFVEKAKQAGAKVHLQHSFLRKEGSNIIIKDLIQKKEQCLRPDLVIGADGPLSPTAKAYGFYHPERENYYGLQAVVKGKFESGKYETFFGQEICPGLFAWLVPESTTIARIGLATQEKAKVYFDKWLTQISKERNLKIIEKQAGLIPLYNPKQILQKDNCYLLGDAAGFVKATTLGGLVPGLRQAEILTDCINHKRNYRRSLRPLRLQLWLHLQIKKVMDKLPDKELNRLISYLNQPRIQNTLSKYTRDNPLPLVFNIFIREPRLLRFIKYIF
ncbi:NAD(P)/FAD-dependent oxidoreductase [Candidatus Woesearchaeota archaeon]|nr:NAD(P)/FAD-dependent oxidoreductase [Candidatus Woesearchaeota archaeon]